MRYRKQDKAAYKEARQRKEPLPIWFDDLFRLRLEDLPFVGEKREFKRWKRVGVYSVLKGKWGDVLKVGRGYGIVSESPLVVGEFEEVKSE